MSTAEKAGVIFRRIWYQHVVDKEKNACDSNVPKHRPKIYATGQALITSILSIAN